MSQDRTNQIFRQWYYESSDFRVLMATDPLLAACVNAGYDPLKLVVALCDSRAQMLKQITSIYENAKPC